MLASGALSDLKHVDYYILIVNNIMSKIIHNNYWNIIESNRLGRCGIHQGLQTCGFIRQFAFSELSGAG